MYGKNGPSPKKRLIIQGLALGEDFARLADELSIAKATAEVYGVDCLAAGQDVSHNSIAEYIDVTKESFAIIKSEIIAAQDKKLRTVHDKLGEVYTYNQIRFVLACLIQDLEL